MHSAERFDAMDYVLTGTVKGEPWYTNGHIMLKGTTTEKPRQAGLKMDSVFEQAIKNLHLAGEFHTDTKLYAQPVKREDYDRQIIDPKYFDMINKDGWKLYIGGKFACNPYGGEKYIVAKFKSEVVAIVAPMRQP